MPEESPAPSSEKVPSSAQPAPPAGPLPAASNPKPPKDNSNKKWLALIAIILVTTSVTAALLWKNSSKPAPKAIVVSKNTASTATAQASLAQATKLDTAKAYGNKYANGILPVGDSKYVTDKPEVGYVYACSTYAQNLKTDQGGAQVRGPWFTNNNTQYDLNKKLHVQGSVMWQADLSNKVSGSTRTIVTNDLPSHPTGTFPISSSDPAYAYDKNPNSIKGQTLTYSLSASPTYGSPNCMGGEVGVMLTGVALFNAFDAGGRDAGAWEVQDSCNGHPQSSGEYHYHTLSSCIKDISVNTVIGFALDGFPITGPNINASNILTTSDLDVCHGLVGDVTLDGKTVNTYHYVMTQDFPYSASCFRAKAIQPPSMQSQSSQPATQGQTPSTQSANKQQPIPVVPQKSNPTPPTYP